MSRTEGAQSVSQLNASLPTNDEPVANGNEHIQMLKSVLRGALRGRNNQGWNTGLALDPADVQTVYDKSLALLRYLFGSAINYTNAPPVPTTLGRLGEIDTAINSANSARVSSINALRNDITSAGGYIDVAAARGLEQAVRTVLPYLYGGTTVPGNAVANNLQAQLNNLRTRLDGIAQSGGVSHAATLSEARAYTDSKVSQAISQMQAQINSLSQQVAQLASRPSGPSVDMNALLTQLGPLLYPPGAAFVTLATGALPTFLANMAGSQWGEVGTPGPLYLGVGSSYPAEANSQWGVLSTNNVPEGSLRKYRPWAVRIFLRQR